MGNTLGTTNGTLIAQRTLETLLVAFPILSQVSTDFSDEAAKLNQVVMSRVVAATTASDYDATNGYVAIDRTTYDVPVTISQHKHHTYSVNDAERSSTNRNLINEYAASGAHALGKTVVDALFALATRANFGGAGNANVTVQALGGFTRNTIIGARTKLNKRFVPEISRFMCLNSDFYGALLQDPTIVAALYNSGAGDAMTTGKLPNIHGFSLSEYASLPDLGQNLAGICGNKEALLVTSRLPEEPTTDLPLGGIITVVKDPNTGLSLQLRQWYDFGKGKEFRTMTLMFGVAVGVSGATSACDRMELIATA